MGGVRALPAYTPGSATGGVNSDGAKKGKDENGEALEEWEEVGRPSLGSGSGASRFEAGFEDLQSSFGASLIRLGQRMEMADCLLERRSFVDIFSSWISGCTSLLRSIYDASVGAFA